MPAPTSQIKQLWLDLKGAPTLKNIPLYLGSGQMNQRGGPARIVMFPVVGAIQGPYQQTDASLDSHRTFGAHVWGKGFDELEDAVNRFFQALQYQGIGGKPSDENVEPGQFWQGVKEEFDVELETAKDGEGVTILFVAVHAIPIAAQKRGSVDATSFQQLTTTLTTPMGPFDSQVSADTTGFPSGGVLLIDSEQIQYTSLTPTAFTSLVRGANATTPATHSAGAIVSVT